MGQKALPFTRTQIEEIVKKYPTPFHIYDEKGIRDNARRFRAAFSWVPGFKEYFAVKATPNPHILKILREEGCGADCSSLAELVLSERCGITGNDIMFTSNDTPAEEYKKAVALGAIINLDDISHISFLEECAGLPELLSFRYNPGKSRTGNFIIGQPTEAKFGLTREQLTEAYRTVRDLGVKRFGLHTMVASNELDPTYIVESARMLFEVAVELSEELGIRFDFLNLGGGIGIPYKPDDRPMDYNEISEGIRDEYNRLLVKNSLDPVRIFFECGRAMTGPYGALVSTVLHKKETYKNFVGLDACMVHLMRPGMYGAYHHITVLGKEDWPCDHIYDVTGSLCENNDKFAIDRRLPRIEIGDIVVIHDTGAHGHAMGSNYNGKLRCAELLARADGSVKMIRRAETLDDLFATLDFEDVCEVSRVLSA
jgi:diaminopimelate decarboxylase